MPLKVEQGRHSLLKNQGYIKKGLYQDENNIQALK